MNFADELFVYFIFFSRGSFPVRPPDAGQRLKVILQLEEGEPLQGSI